MSTPSVRISEASHRVLKELAEQTGRTMTDLLDKAVDAYRRKVFIDSVNAGYAQLRADPKAWAEVEADRASMAGSLMDGLDPEERWDADGNLLPPRRKKKHG